MWQKGQGRQPVGRGPRSGCNPLHPTPYIPFYNSLHPTPYIHFCNPLHPTPYIHFCNPLHPATNIHFCNPLPPTPKIHFYNPLHPTPNIHFCNPHHPTPHIHCREIRSSRGLMWRGREQIRVLPVHERTRKDLSVITGAVLRCEIVG